MPILFSFLLDDEFRHVRKNEAVQAYSDDIIFWFSYAVVPL
jgi:hypothetical protein